MTTVVEEVLRRHGFAVSEDAVAARLDALLSNPRGGTEIDMSASDVAYLAEYSGVEPASAAELVDLDLRSAGRAIVEAGRSITRQEMAALLDVDPSRVSHQVTAGMLFAYPGGNGRPAFPDWQLITTGPSTKAAVLPHLSAVLAAVPAGTHPVALRAFMTTAGSDLLLEGVPLSPREWLSSGGDPAEVINLAATLGEQV